jgi:Isoleucyl-tRNA synthetase
MSKKDFKTTLNLPKTDFSIRANAKEKELELLQRWENEKLYAAAVGKNKGQTFSLQDGPPFANGHMHMGHALNRTLKDMVCKIKRMTGHHVISIPGWDCHGLPIELKVVKELEGTTNYDRVEFKKRCREYARKWIKIQQDEIKRIGVVTDWENHYETMSPQYEASILRSFAVFLEKGYIERKGKTVPWCASCQTVLATAEIEYKDRKDPSCYVMFPFKKDIAQQIFHSLYVQNPELEVSLLVWTTTPWTLPLNRAVVIHPTATYVVLQLKNDNRAFIVGEERAEQICAEMGLEVKVLTQIKPEVLQGQKVSHPYIHGLQVPVILDDMVLLDDGTACVHSAPGCGPEDYFLGIKNGLEIFSPLSAQGTYTSGIEPKELEGMSVTDGQGWSISQLVKANRLLFKGSVLHAYPHCWRCHNPLIFRATDQWFCDLRKDNLVEKAIAVAQGLDFVPEWGRVRLTASMASRTEWCLSRQRQWGVPITAIMCNKCNHPHIDAPFVRGVAEYVAQEGVEFWDRVTMDELKVKGILPQDFSCAACGNNIDFRKIYFKFTFS